MSASEGDVGGRVCAFLRTGAQGGERGHAAGEIAAALGGPPVGDVNRALYELERGGAVRRTRTEPPLWSLAGSEPEPRATTGASPEPGPPDPQSVLKVLLSAGPGGGLPAHRIARELGVSRKSANQQLYSLLRGGQVDKTEGPPVLWRLPSQTQGEGAEGPRTAAPCRPGVHTAATNGRDSGPVPRPQPAGPGEAHALAASFQHLALGEGTRREPQDVLGVLEGLPSGTTAPAALIARKLGVPKKTANQHLYRLLREGRVRMEQGTPPKWGVP
ncbi:uncharacterized protein [Lepisosteus oculatus]|uniref:uncharacterized protein n=1 Tax=Lepisosteus oculatus TaxID=7918 RepID=UPI003715C744